MRKNRRGLVVVEKNDSTWDLPKQWEMNVDAITEQLDAMEEQINSIKRDIEDLKRLYCPPELR